MTSETRSFEGLHVLLVEDNFLVGTSIRTSLQALGCAVMGPYATVEDAQAALVDSRVDCAILDINIRGGTSEPLADMLAEKGIPYFFVTGYRSPVLLGQHLRSVVRVPKPVHERPLQEALAQILA